MAGGVSADPISGHPTSEIPPEKITEWLVAECRDVGNQVAHLNAVTERIMGTVVAALALTVTIAVGGGRAYLAMCVPVLLTVIWAYVLVSQSDLRGLAAYKAELEIEISRRCGFPISQWESTVVAGQHSRTQVRVGWFVSFVLLAMSSVAALAAAFTTRKAGSWGHEHSDLFVVLTVLSILVEVAVIVILTVANQHTATRVAASVRRSFAASAA
ncbi:hypothetical protein [Asanoa iriomotensis]|uniref:Uncharacterized protein n=1 Tax=Asanoa iriomotensis TaxID=234613 RepID=A0ABQ4BU14_9ACTN|nr:hypothetical protein [Asanoa iriomotensis]GIF54020.1 hypothetical protein Air01nite_01150 [Asanoa iriomotensis]